MAEEKVFPKAGAFDITKRVEVIATEKHLFHKAGTKINVAPAIADKLKRKQWAR